MTARLRAGSISHPVEKRLRAGPQTARVLASFEHAVDLVAGNDEVVALVTAHIGDGPLNVVVDGPPGCFAGINAGMAAVLTADRITIDDRLVVSLEDAIAWESCPDWATLRARREIIAGRLPAIRAFAHHHAPPESLLSALERGQSTPVVAVAREALAHLAASWTGDGAAVQDGARRLAGLGNGLTPAGDDVLVGAMLRAWLDHPDPRTFCRIVAEEACPRTTTLSAAFLRAAARGECSVHWQQLLEALAIGDRAVDPTVKEILRFGATSGGDTLAGFLF